MTEKEFAEELEYLSDVVYWLGEARDKKTRLGHLFHIKRQVEYIEERLDA